MTIYFFYYLAFWNFDILTLWHYAKMTLWHHNIITLWLIKKLPYILVQLYLVCWGDLLTLSLFLNKQENQRFMHIFFCFIIHSILNIDPDRHRLRCPWSLFLSGPSVRSSVRSSVLKNRNWLQGGKWKVLQYTQH